ncbi:MAG TPA: rod-binding protein [Acetobacteraceae bacterium]|nr:rod-binding protein [Acetobacteraceae bacterium]
MMLAPSAAPAIPPGSDLPPAQTARLWQAAQNFEAMALGELLTPMFETVDSAHNPFGGGEAEAAWKPLFVQEIGKQMAAQGGLGLARPVFEALLHAQEKKR